ncbi:MAG: RecQ family ATP-dependent DNA helicase [Chloroflexota bacterium]
MAGAETRAEAAILLKQALGPDAEFRDGQLDAIVALVDDHARELVVQRTGWGKSLVYFIATKLLRQRGGGVTLIISPLLSLMADQQLMASRLGIRANRMASDNSEDWDQLETDLGNGELDVLFVSPERLANERFRTRTLPSIKGGVGMLVIDEAHFISDWGHDYRPDYRRIIGIVRTLPTSVPILATTATANNRVVEDIESQLGGDLIVSRGPLARRSLQLQAITLPTAEERLAWLAQHVPELPGSGIIYTLTVRDAEVVSAWLISKGVNAPFYHGEMQPKDRAPLEDALRNNRVKALVATIALGMGFDKPDLGFVIHYQRPGSVVAYYQQVGRAGRAIEQAVAILLDGEEDSRIHEWFIETAFPTLPEQEAIVEALDQANSLNLRHLEGAVNMRRGRLSQALKHLEVDGIVIKDGSNYSRTVNPFVPDTSRADGISALRRHEGAQMQAFVSHDGCLMEFVSHELDDPDAKPCGTCANCRRRQIVSVDIDLKLMMEAALFLRRADDPIKPRIQIPAGAYSAAIFNLPPEHRCEWGRALCVYGESGLGRMVRSGKYSDHRFSEDLLDAAVECITERWKPTPEPTWVTWVPSRRDTVLVPDFARRLADRLGLPSVAALAKLHDTAQQKEMQNSVQQARNVGTAFSAVPQLVRPGAVLLVDDIVDSGWTFTSAGAKLRRSGSGPVFPFALARMRTQADD